MEPDLVYPLLRGRDVKKWYAEFRDRYVVLPVDPQGRDIEPSDMRVKYPNTYKYFLNFFNDLISRSGEPYKTKLEPYKRLPLEKAEKAAPPFYWVFNAKPSLAPFKVVWKEVSARMGAGGFHVAVLEHVSDTYLGNKTVVPDHTVVLIPLASREEAYYLAGVLNSILVALVLQYAVVSSVENLSIPKFDPNNVLHRKIAELSVRAHELARCLYARAKPSYCSSVNAEEELRRVKREIDLAVVQLFDLSEEDLREFERLMAVLSGEELPAEEEAEVPEEPGLSTQHSTTSWRFF